VSKAAEILRVRRATLSDLLTGKASLSPEMALRIEKAFGADMNHLLRMQLAYDVAQVQRRRRQIVVERYKMQQLGGRTTGKRHTVAATVKVPVLLI
jgi:addiction module HigA family antidote